MDSDEDDLPIPAGAADMSAFAHVLSSQPIAQEAPLGEARQGEIFRRVPRTQAASATFGTAGRGPAHTSGRGWGAATSNRGRGRGRGFRSPAGPSSSGRAQGGGGAGPPSARGRGRGKKPTESAQRAADAQFKQAFQAMGGTHVNGTQQIPAFAPGREQQGQVHTAVFAPKPTRLPPGFIPPEKQTPVASGPAEVEEFTGLLLRSRRMAVDDLKQQIVDARFYKLQSLRSLVLGGELSGKWATGGILVKKGPTRESTGGKPYAAWTLSTLSKEGGEANLLVLGAAFTEHWKEVEGTVFIVVGAEASAGKLGYSSNPYLKVFSAHQLLPIGSSKDFGICKGGNTDSAAAPCTAVINKSLGDYCVAHAGEMYDKYKTQRMEVGGGYDEYIFPHAVQGNLFLHKAKKIRRSMNLLAKDEPKQQRPAAPVTADQMKDMLKKKDVMTSRTCSQGKRFLMLASGVSPTPQPSGQLPSAAAAAFGKGPRTLNENKRVSPSEPPKAGQKRPAKPPQS